MSARYFSSRWALIRISYSPETSAIVPAAEAESPPLGKVILTRSHLGGSSPVLISKTEFSPAAAASRPSSMALALMLEQRYAESRQLFASCHSEGLPSAESKSFMAPSRRSSNTLASAAETAADRSSLRRFIRRYSSMLSKALAKALDMKVSDASPSLTELGLSSPRKPNTRPFESFTGVKTTEDTCSSLRRAYSAGRLSRMASVSDMLMVSPDMMGPFQSGMRPPKDTPCMEPIRGCTLPEHHSWVLLIVSGSSWENSNT